MQRDAASEGGTSPYFLIEFVKQVGPLWVFTRDTLCLASLDLAMRNEDVGWHLAGDSSLAERDAVLIILNVAAQNDHGEP